MTLEKTNSGMCFLGVCYGFSGVFFIIWSLFYSFGEKPDIFLLWLWLAPIILATLLEIGPYWRRGLAKGKRVQAPNYMYSFIFQEVLLGIVIYIWYVYVNRFFPTSEPVIYGAYIVASRFFLGGIYMLGKYVGWKNRSPVHAVLRAKAN